MQYLGNERLNQVGLRLSGQAFERASKADKFRRRFASAVLACSPANSSPGAPP
jgi:hypothetical protein